MRKDMESNSRSPAIYRRFINFIRSKLNCPSGTEVPVEEGGISRKNGFVGSEIVVEFRHMDGSEMSAQINHRTILHEKERKGHQELEGLTRNVTIKGSDGEGERTKKKESHEDAKLKPIRHKKPLVSVASNINQKSEAYIESRKKAMQESYEQKKQP